MDFFFKASLLEHSKAGKSWHSDIFPKDTFPIDKEIVELPTTLYALAKKLPANGFELCYFR